MCLRPGDYRQVVISTVKEVGGPSFFCLMVIAVGFLPVFTLVVLIAHTACVFSQMAPYTVPAASVGVDFSSYRQVLSNAADLALANAARETKFSSQTAWVATNDVTKLDATILHRFAEQYGTVTMRPCVAPSQAAFIAWSDKYLLQRIIATMYSFRPLWCSLWHPAHLSPESDLSRKGTARHIFYAWGNAKTDELERASKQLGKNNCVLHVRELINAFRVGLANYLQETKHDNHRAQKLSAGAGMWFTNMDQNTVKAFLETYKP
jgi:hypothetical protein